MYNTPSTNLLFRQSFPISVNSNSILPVTQDQKFDVSFDPSLSLSSHINLKIYIDSSLKLIQNDVITNIITTILAQTTFTAHLQNFNSTLILSACFCPCAPELISIQSLPFAHSAPAIVFSVPHLEVFDKNLQLIWIQQMDEGEKELIPEFLPYPTRGLVTHLLRKGA